MGRGPGHHPPLPYGRGLTEGVIALMSIHTPTPSDGRPASYFSHYGKVTKTLGLRFVAGRFRIPKSLRCGTRSTGPQTVLGQRSTLFGTLQRSGQSRCPDNPRPGVRWPFVESGPAKLFVKNTISPTEDCLTIAANCRGQLQGRSSAGDCVFLQRLNETGELWALSFCFFWVKPKEVAVGAPERTQGLLC
jgi:hypothetical protein